MFEEKLRSSRKAAASATATKVTSTTATTTAAAAARTTSVQPQSGRFRNSLHLLLRRRNVTQVYRAMT